MNDNTLNGILMSGRGANSNNVFEYIVKIGILSFHDMYRYHQIPDLTLYDHWWDFEAMIGICREISHIDKFCFILEYNFQHRL